MKKKDYSLFDNLIEGIQVISKEYEYIYVNDTLAMQLGVPKESMIGKSIVERFPNLKDHDIYLRIQQCMTERIVVKDSRAFKLPDGSIRWAEIKAQPFESGLLIMSTDITKRKEYEQQLAKLNQELEFLVNSRTLELVEALERAQTINTIKSNFLSMTSHELNTPLASIKLCVGVLEKLNAAPNMVERKEYHDYIKEEVGNLLKMLGSFADNVPLIQEASQEMLDVPLLVHRLTKELKGMCEEGQAINYKHKGVQLLQVDENILRRILLNLLANAIKYSKKDITIQTKAKKGTLRIKIRDEGIGIPKAEQNKLFTKFFRATNVTTIQGTGLGLHIVKNYVELMNGTIKFKSKEHKGTSFTVIVPVTMLMD